LAEEAEMFDTKKNLRWSKLRVGLVITIAFVVLCLAVFFAGNIQSLLSEKAELKIQFKDVEGLRKGAPVWILGLEEGYVREIHLNPAYGVVVTVAVNQNALRFIKKDSRAAILTMGLLGDKYIELSTGSPEAEPVRPGEMLKGMTEVGLRGIMETSGRTIETMNSFIKRLDDLVTKIESGRGTLAKFIEDPSLYNNLTKTTQHLSQITDEIKNSRGTWKLLIEDPSLYNRISAAASSIEEFSRRINESSGTLKSLIEDPSLYRKTLAAASQMEEFTKDLNQSHGTLKKLIENPDLYENLNRDLKQLSSILEHMDRGEGVAGVLIRDKELARELKETVAELKELLKNIKDHPKKYFKFSLF
jgi:phospholipid/cholesterol/gamma-HCH transport system substrate-binding protein